jgi:hypothetical protein
VPSHFPIGEELAVSTRRCVSPLLLFALLLAAGTIGCPRKAVYVTVPKPVPPKRANITPLLAPDVPAQEPGDLELAFVTLSPPTPPPGHNSHVAPPAHKPAADSTPPSRPAPPQISPQISPADQAAYEHRTNDSISDAEKNLQQVAGHQLSSSQQEMVEKIQGFIKQAHEALLDADYTRAQNLAQKAQLLSVELVNTL